MRKISGAASLAALTLAAVGLQTAGGQALAQPARPGAVDTPLWEKVPLRLPRTALAPTELAQRVLDAYHAGVTGTLDL